MKRWRKFFKWVPIGVAVVVAAFVHGFLTHRHQIFPYGAVKKLVNWSTWHRQFPDRSWQAARGAAETDTANLPYAAGYRPPPPREGVTLHEAGAAPGVNLYHSGHDTAAILMDMEGRELFRWKLGAIQPWMAHAPAANTEFVFPEWGYWRRVKPLPDGGLLAIYENAGLVKLDRTGKVDWAFWGGCHHDLHLSDAGEIFVIARHPRVVRRFHPDRPVWDDEIVVLNRRGQVLRRVSILDCFTNSPFEPMLDQHPGDHDLFHTNTVIAFEEGEGRGIPFFGPGTVLVSIRNLNALAVLDMERATVVWAVTGQWRRQHEPVPMANGRLLLFNNQFRRDRSQILEIDPLTRAVTWEYHQEDGGFYSRILGSCQVLPNGSVLITESEGGRAFEITREKRMVWEFLNPHRAGEKGELIATLFEMRRFPADYFDSEFRQIWTGHVRD